MDSPDIALVSLPAGDYVVGDDNHPLCRPAHTVTLRAFGVGRTAVTNAEFAAFVGAGGYRQPTYWSAIGWRWRESKSAFMPAFWGDPRFDAPEQPVIGVCWYEAQAFCQWLTDVTGQPWRLPAEVEWEAAARQPGEGVPHSAGMRPAQPIAASDVGYVTAAGAHNLLGNVWEWCSTRWGRNWQTLDYAYPYTADDGREDLSGSAARIIRGGSWFDPLSQAKPHIRARYLPGSRASNIGFRLACSLA